MKEPALHATQLPAGQCVRGFVPFQVPIRQKPSFVVFALTFDRFPRLLLVASLVTFALNIYGLAGWKHFPRQPRDAPWLQGLPAASPPPDVFRSRDPAHPPLPLTSQSRAVPPNKEG